VNYFLKIN